MKKFLFLNVCHEKKLSSVRIEPATVGSEPILAEKRHLHKSRPEADITKSCKIKFQLGPGGFSIFKNVLGPKILFSSIFAVYCQLVPWLLIFALPPRLKSRQKST